MVLTKYIVGPDGQGEYVDMTPDEEAAFEASRIPVLSPDDVWAERDRRLALGFYYDFGDYRGVQKIGTTPSDMVGWSEVTTWANTKHALGEDTAETAIMTDTGVALITPTDWFHILDAAATIRQNIWTRSFILASMSPIPQDYTDGTYWVSGIMGSSSMAFNVSATMIADAEMDGGSSSSFSTDGTLDPTE